jgi:FKBP-type peptidyl-prolyl cis-trans isomerase (trigger factor)|tara:strand:+ start:1909 stop:2037 length:129 start_codon:yes stop_codon:yes gene_type:complete
LEEANQYGLRYEVDEFAKKFLEEDPTLSDLEAYVMAYNEWIK